LTEINVSIPDEPSEEVKEVSESVGELAESVETLAQEVAQPTEILQHDHPEMGKRLDKLEESTDTLIKREVARTVEDMQREKEKEKPEPEPEPVILFTPEETTATTEEIAPPEREVTVIDPPVARSKPENPPGVWGFVKKLGF
jgi:hypothetical protein